MAEKQTNVISDSLDKNDELTPAEKQKLQDNLKKVKLEDYEKVAGEIEGEQFNLGGKSVTLKDIIMNIDTTEDTVNYKGIKIPRESDVAAAIQTYLIVKGYSLWSTWIDGKIGTNTKTAIERAKNGIRNEDLAKQFEDFQNWKENNEDEYKVQNVDQLVNTTVYDEYVGEYNNPKYNLLTTNWKLKNATINGNKVTIKYKSAINNETQTITVDANECKKWKLYSVDDFWKAIEDAITQNERNLWNDKLKREAEEKENNENDSIKEWIKNFNENTISKKFIKDYLQDIKYVNYSHQLFTIKNSRDWKEKQIHRNALLTNGKFDGVKFRQRLEMVYEQDAKNYNVKSWINDFKETSIGNKVVQWYFKEKRLNITCSKVWIAEITVRDNLGKSKPFLRQDIVWNDGLFNAQNYENKLVELYEAAAIEHYKTTFETRENRIKSTIITDLDSAKTYSQQCDGIIKDISLINSENYTELNGIKTRVTELKQNAENDKKRFEQEQKNNNEYENFKKQMDKDLSIIKSKAGKKLSAIDMQQAKEDCLNLLRKYINITPVSGKYDTYKQESLKNDANKFIKVHKKQEYLDKVKEMKDYIGYFGVHFEY